MISPAKEEELLYRMRQLGIREEDLREHFIRSSGPGGQNVQKTSTCVHLVHLPTQIEVKCQQSRSQALNRFLARRLLCEKLEEKQLGRKSSQEKERERIKKQKSRRRRRARGKGKSS